MSGPNFSCSLTGYTEMVDEILNLALLAITVNVSIIEAILFATPDLQQAFNLLYRFLKGAGGFSGYLLGAIYYFGLEFGYGDLLCELSGYGYVVIYYLNLVITFGQSSS